MNCYQPYTLYVKIMLIMWISDIKLVVVRWTLVHSQEMCSRLHVLMCNISTFETHACRLKVHIRQLQVSSLRLYKNRFVWIWVIMRCWNQLSLCATNVGDMLLYDAFDYINFYKVINRECCLCDYQQQHTW